LTFILFDVLHQKQQHHLSRRSRSLPNFSDKNAWVRGDNDKHFMGRFSLYHYEELSSKSKQKEGKEAQKKLYETKDIFTQTFKSNLKLDKHLATYKPRRLVPDNNERLLEDQPPKDNRSIIRSIDRGKTRTQKTYDQISTEGRSDQFPSTYSPSKSESGTDAKETALGSWQLFRDEHVDASKSSKAQYTSSNSHNKISGKKSIVSLPKLLNVPCHLLDQLKDEFRDFTEKDMSLLNADRRETFAKLFGITEIFPLYLDRRTELIMLFLDENNCLFMWNQMECSMIYMGSDLEEGITNCLIYPNRMCYIIEDTFERVPLDKYEHQLEEKFKNHMEEGFNEMLLEAKANIMAQKRKKAKKKLSKNK
jgi:hypothetical protein